MPARRGRVRAETAVPSCSDPLSRLNHDVVHMILLYLAIDDILRLELVSRAWRDMVREWMRRFGTRYLIQPTWYPGGLAEPMKPLPYEELRDHARTIHRTQTGLLSSAHNFEDMAFFAVGAQYAVWVSRSDASSSQRHRHANYEMPSDIISWRSMAAGRPQMAVKAARLWRVGSEGVTVGSLLLNEEGILLVSLKYGHPHLKGERDIVYSLATNKIIWSRDRDVRRAEAFMPFAIGVSHIYAASWDPAEERYMLVAEDFRRKKRRYASAGLPSNWPFAYDHFHDFQSYGMEFAKVARISDEEELVLQLKQTGDSSSREIEIIRGTDGTLVGRVPCTRRDLHCAMSHPPTGHIAFTTPTWRLPEKVENALEAFGRYQVFITRRFSNHCEVGLQLLSVDVVLVPREWLIRPNYRLESLVVIDPFHRTAFISSARKPKEEYSNSGWTIFSCPLVLTEDSGLRAAAMAAIPHALAGSKDIEDPNVVSQCYILAEGNKITLPAKPKKGRDKREALELPHPMGNWHGRVAGGQVSLFLEEEHYVLNFV